MYDFFKVFRSGVRWTSKTRKVDSEIEVAAWAKAHALTFEGRSATAEYAVSGSFQGRPWKIERRRASRQFIQGEELMGRAVLNLQINPVVVVMNRALKESLEKQAYAIYTDQIRTLAEPTLTEEMRWLALYPECLQTHRSNNFHQMCTVIAASEPDARRWLTKELAELVEKNIALDPKLPFILMVLRGKVYLHRQLELQPESTRVTALSDSYKIFELASESALTEFAANEPC